MTAPLDPALLDQIKAMLRRDLKLGADIDITGDMPLIGGPVDIDSIDILLVVSSIEKQFHIKIPSEAIGRSAFASVASLAKYVQDNRETLRAEPAASSVITMTDWLSRLPHGPEFRFVTGVREVNPGKAAVGFWSVRGDEHFLKGHFPGRPIVPGVLITEALAQLAGIASTADGIDRGGVLASADMRFLAPAIPPVNIELQATVTGSRGKLQQCEVIASVGGQPVARGSLMLHFGGVI
jgi:3-hydroxyacyl-[acyl-carrier-protein] dehydratase